MTASKDILADRYLAKSSIHENAIIKKISLVSIVGNIILSGFKLFAGIYGRSGAMISDSIHSMSDVITTFIAFLGVKISKKPADKEHPAGVRSRAASRSHSSSYRYWHWKSRDAEYYRWKL